MRTRTHRGLSRRAWTAALALFAGLLLPVSGAAAATTAPGAYQAPYTPAPGVAGATTPFATYQAPEGALGGGAGVVSLTSSPTSEYDSPQGEADGHAYVQLAGAGQSVQWTNQTGQPIDFLNVRASIPDSSSGGGQTATLDLYVNGAFRQAIDMNSIQSWEYEGNNNYNGSDENPGDGDPRDFWDEFHTFVTGTPIPAGATFSLQKDSSNTASFYWINSVDVWNAPAAAVQPANSISITSCGAVADDTPTNGAAAPGATDSTVDIQNCVNQAEADNEILWIPSGTFYMIGTSSIVVNNITVEGAGYWYSEIYRDVPLPNNTPLGSALQCTSCHLQSFHIDSDSTSRAEVDGGGGAEDTTGTNWSIENMWVQHVESSVWASGSGGIVENNFFTSIFADGCNLNNVSLTGTSGSNLTATNNFIRGTGDDGMAINSVAYNGSTTYTAMTGITMTHNTVIAPWGGKGIGVYGGSGHVVDDNFISDTARYIGLGIGRFGVNGSDMTGATVSGNYVVRSGGDAYFQGQPAMQIGNGGDGQNVGTVTNATVTDNSVIQAVYDGFDFSTSTATNLSDNQVIDPWRNGIVISPQYYPAPSGNASITDDSVTGFPSGDTAFADDSGGFSATASGDSWQNAAAEGAYGGAAAAVPGTVQAVNYDTGGQGVGYNVNSVNGTSNSYRSDGVDIEACTDTGASGCGYDLGWSSQGQWFRYTVNVASAGTYTLGLRVAAPSAVADAFHLTDSQGDAITGAETIPATGAFQTYTTVSDTVVLPAGRQTLLLDEDNGGYNLRSLSLTASGSGTGPTASPLTASTSSVAFGNANVGSTSATQSVTVSNPGGTAASLSSITVSGPFAQTNNCGGSIAAGGSCAVQLSFKPTASGAAAGSFSVASNAPGSPLTVALSGNGVSSSTNLALNRPATAGGYTQTYVPANAVDGNTSSYWESTDNAFPQWLQVDLGSSIGVGRIVMDLPPSSSWATRTQTVLIQGSTDGTNYTTLAAAQGYTFNPSTGNTVTVTFTGTAVRYVKLTFTANTGWPAGQLSELQVFTS